MPKYIVHVDLDSPREEGEHIEKKFEKGIEAPDEHEAEQVVDKFIKDNMYGGPYYSIEEDKPKEDKVYALTGGPGSRCIANGNSWKESEVKDDK